MVDKEWNKEKRTTKPIKDSETLLKLMNVYPKHSRNYLLLAVCLNTGLRISDVIGLKLSDIKGSELNLIEKKTKKDKVVGINNDLRALVEDTAKENILDGSDYLFFNQHDKRSHISRVQAFRIVHHAGQMIGIGISPHSLRKTFGYIHYTRTKDVAQLMYIFNHSAPNVTLKYIGIDDESAFQNVYSHSIGI